MRPGARLRAAERGAPGLRGRRHSRAAWCCRRGARHAAGAGLSFSTQAALADDPAHSAIRELTLSLDVPQVPRSEQPFVRMRDAAIALAAPWTA
jgi:hypothetical protein